MARDHCSHTVRTSVKNDARQQRKTGENVGRAGSAPNERGEEGSGREALKETDKGT